MNILKITKKYKKMIKLQNFNFKTKMSEFTIEEFEKISNILNEQSNNYIDMYLRIMESLGATDEVINKITDEEFFNFVKSFNKDQKYDKTLTRNIVINNRKFKAYDDKFSLKAKDLLYIEKFLKEETISQFSKILAVLFKEENIKDHFNEEHINEKSELFKNLPSDKYFSYIVFVTDSITKKLNTLIK